jgi:hypothetical protein
MKAQESVQMYCVKEQMTDGDRARISKWELTLEDCDIIGQTTASLTTITAVVKQAEGDKYVTSSLVLPFINTCMKALQKMVLLSSRGLTLETHGVSTSVMPECLSRTCLRLLT